MNAWRKSCFLNICNLFLVALIFAVRSVTSETTVVFETAVDYVETICINNTVGRTSLLSANTFLVGSFKELNDVSTICAPSLEFMSFKDGQIIHMDRPGEEWENVGWRVPLVKKSESASLSVVLDNNIYTNMVVDSLLAQPLYVEGGPSIPAVRFKVSTESLDIWNQPTDSMVLSYVASKWAALISGDVKISAAILVHEFKDRADGLNSRFAQVFLSRGVDGNVELRSHSVEVYQESKRRRILLSSPPPRPPPPSSPPPPPDLPEGYYYYNGYYYNPSAVGCTRVCILLNPPPPNCYSGYCRYRCYCQ